MLTEREGALKYFNRSDVSGVRGLVPHPQLPRALPGDTLPPPTPPWGPSARWSQPFPLVWVALEALRGPRGTGLAPCRQVRGPGQRVEELAGPARGHQGICSPGARRRERSGRQGGEQEGGTWPRVGWTRWPALTPPGKVWLVPLDEEAQPERVSK